VSNFYQNTIDQLGPYSNLKKISHGGMATVYLGKHTQMNRDAAIKVMHQHLAQDPTHRDRFIREAKSIASLNHPNIVKIYDCSVEGSQWFIAFEYIADGSLEEFISKQSKIPPEYCLEMVKQILSGLDLAHNHGIIHRDVKPSNILLHNGTLKLTDFGIASLMGQKGMTATGQAIGSPNYMPIEQIDGKKELCPFLKQFRIRI